SLPSAYGIGDFGPSAYRFIDFLARSGQQYWQILPLTPTDPVFGHSPYHSSSAFAISTLLISPELLVADGFCTERDLPPPSPGPSGRVDYASAEPLKREVLDAAFRRFSAHPEEDGEYSRFCREQACWLDDHALFVALKEASGGKRWSRWPPALRDRDPEALEAARRDLAGRIEKARVLQYIAACQWSALHAYCNHRSVRIIGDLPIYITHDSADVWAHPELFQLDEEREPSVVAGVPPDYFSSTGQRWGNPVFRWEVMEEQEFSWWKQRISHGLSLFDLLRIDHFRGFVAYWEIPAGEKTAMHGRWVPAPADTFFRELQEAFPDLPLIAEDLGTITDDVRALMNRLGFPGMKVLQFAFGEDIATNPYIPHNITQNSVVYTGTHDNNTTRGWFVHEITDQDRDRLFRYLGREVSEQEVAWAMVRLAIGSVARVAVIPLQDLLGLGAEARINTPGTGSGNWAWQLLPGDLSDDLSLRLSGITKLFGRK
ncbi:MAG: 4-alpha-glucanotransferase, partial [Methanomicrobiaceae archaeon]|nr:4-alpha-glucanotransferase [Methanomicrobiaceae archaeon]